MVRHKNISQLLVVLMQALKNASATVAWWKDRQANINQKLEQRRKIPSVQGKAAPKARK